MGDSERKLNFTNSLKFKLLLNILLMALIPLIGLSIIAYTMTRKQLQSQISSSLELAASEALDKIDRFVYQKIEDVKSWSRNPIIKGTIFFGVVDLAEAYFSNNMVSLPEYKSVALFNLSGEEIISVGEAAFSGEGKNRSQAEWFVNALKDNFYITPAVKYANEVRVGISVPAIDGETKQIIGVMLAELDFGVVKEITASVKVTANEQDQTLTIINNEGTVIFDADESKIFKENLLKEGFKSAKVVIEENKNGNIVDLDTKRLVGFAVSKGYKEFKGHLWNLLLAVRLGAVLTPVMRLRNNFTLLILVTLIVITILGILMSRRISLPISLVASSMLDIAEKEADLTKKINFTSKDELGLLVTSFNKIIDSIYNLVGQVKISAEKLASSAEQQSSSTQQINASTQQITNAMQEMSRGAVTQAKQVEESFETMKRSTISLREVVANARKTSEAITQTSMRAKNGQVAAQEAADKIERLTNNVLNSVAVIQELGKISSQIGEITKTITAIAEQTNLLALNAAIEAARAGEAGRGFAVVAEEVRKLAEGSAESVKKIGGLVNAIQTETKRAVIAIETSAQEAQEGKTEVNKIAQLLTEITQTANIATDLANRIAVSGEERVEEVERVLKTINQVTTIAKESASRAQEVSSSTEEQTALMQEMSAQAQELARLAVDLRELVSRFKLKDKPA